MAARNRFDPLSVRDMPDPSRVSARFVASDKGFAMCDRGPRCKGQDCKFAHSSEELRYWNALLKEWKRQQSLGLNPPDKYSWGQGYLPSASIKKYGYGSSFQVSRQSSYEFHARRETKYYEDRCKNPPPKKDAEKELTQETYKSKFSSLLYLEEKHHSWLLSERCDGEYEIVVHKRQYVPWWVTHGNASSRYGAISGMTGDQIMYASQASQQLFIVNKSAGQTKNPEKICYAGILQENMLCRKDNLLIEFTKEEAEKLEKCFQLSDDKIRRKFSVQFEVKHFFFNQLERVLVNLSPAQIRKVMPAPKSDDQNDNALHAQDLAISHQRPYDDFMKLDEESQIPALQKVIRSRSHDPVLICGAFGTGKTRLLAVATYHFIEKGKRRSTPTRVLLCCHHQLTADTFVEDYFGKMINCHNKIQRWKVKLVRLTRSNYYCDAGYPHLYSDFTMFRQVFLSEYAKERYVVIVTTFQTSINIRKTVGGDYFTHILLDEAAQVREPEAVAPLCMANQNTKIVIAGDDQQVGPSILVLGKKPQKNGLGKSLFTRLLGQYGSQLEVAVLNTNHHCHEDIVSLARSLFYRNDLKVADGFKPICVAGVSCPIWFVCSSSLQTNITQLVNKDTNSDEAKALIQQLQIIFKGTKQLDDVCIMTTNRNQLSVLKRMLKPRQYSKSPKFLPTYLIQGGEFKALFMSTVESLDPSGCSSNPSKSLCSPVVFNTAITRAKSLIVAVGNPYTLMTVEENMDNSKRCWAEYLNRCFKENTFVPMNGTTDEALKELKRCVRKKLPELRQDTNRWVRFTERDEDTLTEYQRETQLLLRRFCCILNKLTPQKFRNLSEQVIQLPINNVERLKGCVDMVFEKALIDPIYSRAYANVCCVMASINVTKGNESTFSFRTELLSLCKKEFDKLINNKELKIWDGTARARSLANIRFIGELFRLHILAAKVMHDCAAALLYSVQSEEKSVECFCTLITTAGKGMDEDEGKQMMDEYYRHIEMIIAQKKISNRLRFLLFDIQDLRKNQWVPQRHHPQDAMMTIDELHKQAEEEELATQAKLATVENSVEDNDPSNKTEERTTQQVTTTPDNNADDISQKTIQESEQSQLDTVKLQDKEEQLFKPGDLQKNYEKPSFNEEDDQLHELMQLLKDVRAKVAVKTTSEKQPLYVADVIDCLVKLRSNQEEQEQLQFSLQAWEIVAEQQNLHLKTMQGQLSELQASNQKLQDALDEKEKQTNSLGFLNDCETIKAGPLSTQDALVQANYLSVAPDFLRGVEVYGETVLEVVGDKRQKLEWAGYGFYIEVPEGALTADVTASVAVKVILGGQFQLPENSQLISAVYWISCSEVFLKEVAVNIQHCAVIRSEEQCSNFKFIIAKSSQKELPYTFREKAGIFNSNTQYATIRLKQFCMIGGTAPTDTETLCTALMFYKEQILHMLKETVHVDFHFVVVKDLEPYLEEVRKKYLQWTEDNHSLEIYLKDSAIILDLQEQEVDPWKIVPLAKPQITKEAVAMFKEGKRIPHCAFEFQLLEGRSLQRLFHRVNLIGLSSEKFFHIRYPQPENASAIAPAISAAQPSALDSSVATTSVQSDMAHSSPPTQGSLDKPPNIVDLLNKVACKARDKWKMMGLALGIELNQLNSFSKQYDADPIMCYTEVFSTWKKNTDPPFTWATVIKSLKLSIVGETELAMEIEESLRGLDK